MSSVTNVNNTGNQAQFDYDVSKIFVWNNRYSSATFINGTGGELSFAAGTVVGRIAASNKITICDSTATDGSQIPVGVLKTPIVALANAGEVTANYCHAGDVVEDKLVFSGAETLATVVTIQDSVPAATNNTRTMRDLIQSVGINIIASTDLTAFDNQ